MAASSRCRAPRVALLLPLLAPVIASGCVGGASSAGQTTVDSAGVRIVTSSQPAWEHDGWRVDAEPVLDVGRREGDADYLFNRLRDLARLPDGGIVVTNGGDNSVRRYDAGGTLVWRAGGSGGGPGEYAAVGQVRLIGDTILVLDDSGMRPAHLYDLDGRQIGTIGRYPVDPGRPISVYDVFPDGSYLYTTAPQGRVVKGERWLDSASIFRVSADLSRTDSLARVPAVEFSRFDETMGMPVAFAPIFTAVAGDGIVYVNFPDDCDIEAHDFSGRMVRRIRWACAVRTVPEEDIERYRRQYLEAPDEQGLPASPQLRAWRQTVIDKQLFSKRYPAHGGMRVDRQGDLWVRRNTGYRVGLPVEPSTWDVFDRNGVWLGPVTTPVNLNVTEIGADWVAGIWRDADDIEHARVYRLVKE